MIASNSEASEQIKLVWWLENIKRYKFTAIVNETYTPFHSQKLKNAKMGLRKGLPDLLIIVPTAKRNLLVFMEMKNPSKKSKKDINPLNLDRKEFVKSEKFGVRLSQFDWLTALNSCESVQGFVCYSCLEAQNVINKVERIDD